MRTLSDLDLQDASVLVRLDLNVPLADGQITDDGRIQAALPTLKELLAAGAKPVVVAHLGRPKGEVKAELSLAPVATRMAELLGAPVDLAPAGAILPGAPGRVVLLENIRFDARETSKDPAERGRSGCRTGQRHGCLRQRWLRGASSGAGQCDRCREAAAQRRGSTRREGDPVFRRGPAESRPSLQRGAGWVEGLRQTRRDRQLAGLGGPARDRRGYVLHVPRCAGPPHRRFAVRSRLGGPVPGDPGQR